MGGTTVSILRLIYWAKHPVKVHVWAGISMCGWTSICTFDGIMDAPVLQQTLMPFIQQVFPQVCNHCTVSPINVIRWDNDPKQTSNLGNDFFQPHKVVEGTS